MITVGDFLKESGGRFAGTSGFRWDTPQALNYLNRARRMIWNRGDPVGTIEHGAIKITKCCFFLPAHLETVRAMFPFQYGSKADIKGSYYEELERAFIDSCCLAGCEQFKFMKTGESFPLPDDTRHEGCHLWLQPLNGLDNDVKFTVYAEDWQKSIQTDEFTLTDPFHRTRVDIPLGRILELRKSRTYGRVKATIETRSGTVQMDHDLSPFEEHCRYEKYRISPLVDGYAIIKAKRRFYHFTDKDYDRLLDLNPEALEFGMQAVTKKEIDNDDQFVSKLQLTEEQLEEEKQDRLGLFKPRESTFHPDVI